MGPSFTIEAYLHGQGSALAGTIFGDRTRLEFLVDGALSLVITGDEGPVTAVSGRALPTDQWIHVAVSWDGNTARFYHDGDLADEKPLVATPVADAANHTTFAYGDLASGVLIDELKVSSYAKTADQIQMSMSFDTTALVDVCGDGFVAESGTLSCDGETACCGQDCRFLDVSTPCENTLVCNGAGLCVGPDSPERVTDDGLVSLYLFDEGEGAVARDSAGAPEDLDAQDLSGEPSVLTWHPGYVTLNSPVRFVASGTKVAESLADSDAFTIEAWVNPAVEPSDGTRLPARIVALSQSIYSANLVLGQNGAAFTGRVRTGATNLDGNPPIASAEGDATSGNGPHHVVLTHDGGDTRLYVGGILRDRTSRPGDLSLWTTTYPLAIGDETGGSRPFLGDVHLVAVYRRALSPSEIARNFLSGPDPEIGEL